MALLPQRAVFGVKNGSKSIWMATDAWLRTSCSKKQMFRSNRNVVAR